MEYERRSRFASPKVESGNREDSSPETDDGNGRLSIPIVGLGAVLDDVCHHPEKANVVAGVVSQKRKSQTTVCLNPGLDGSLDIHPHLNAQNKVTKQKSIKAENLKRLIK
ncbi:hypothetical protein Tco_0431975 [Tanacetum coccineum]